MGRAKESDVLTLAQYTASKAKAMATAAQYLWPIPNRGLSKRLHRVRPPTLIVWGASDGLCPPEYGPEFQAAIPGAQLAIVPEAGHMLTLERPAELARLIEQFVGA